MLKSNRIIGNLVAIFVPLSARIIDRHRLRSYDVSIKQITGGFHMDALKKDAIMTQKKGLPFTAWKQEYKSYKYVDFYELMPADAFVILFFKDRKSRYISKDR